MDSHYEIEEPDIVRLTNDGGSASGWINVGAHAIHIQLKSGDLRVEAYARTAEFQCLSEFTVAAKAVGEAGGVDPDVFEDDELDADDVTESIEDRLELIVNSESTMQAELDEIPKPGIVFVHDEQDRLLPLALENPDWAEIISAMERLQENVGDYHHVFLEDVRWEEQSNGWHVWPILGS